MTPTLSPAPGPAGLRFAGLCEGLPSPGRFRGSQQQRVPLGAGHGAEPPGTCTARAGAGQVHSRGTGEARPPFRSLSSCLPCGAPNTTQGSYLTLGRSSLPKFPGSWLLSGDIAQFLATPITSHPTLAPPRGHSSSFLTLDWNPPWPLGLRRDS